MADKEERVKITKATHPEYFDEKGRFTKGNNVGIKYTKLEEGGGQRRDDEKSGIARRMTWERRKFREQLFNEIMEADIDIGNNKRVNFVKAFLERLKFALLAKDDDVIKAGFEPLTLNERLVQFLRLIEKLTPEEQNVRLTSDQPVNIVFNTNDKNLI